MGIVRLLLALSVMLGHSGSWLGIELVPAQVAVEVFFMISGFYMAMVLRAKYAGPRGLRRFYKNRFLKLFPAYWAVVALTIGISATSALLWNDWSVLRPWKALAHALSFRTTAFLVFSNVFMLGQDAALFTGIDLRTGSLYLASDFWHTRTQTWTFMVVPQAWSLSLELLFYAGAPLIVRLPARVLACFILAALLLRGYLSAQLGLGGDPWSYRFFPTESALFLAGVLAHRVFVERPIEPYLKKVSAACGVALLASSLLYEVVSRGDWSFRWVYFAIAFVGIPAIFERSKASRVDRALGDLSYPLYIGHVAVFDAVKRINEHTHWRFIDIDVEIVGAFILAYLLNRFVVARMEARRREPALDAERAPAPTTAAPAEASRETGRSSVPRSPVLSVDVSLE